MRLPMIFSPRVGARAIFISAPLSWRWAGD
jgi:hypothetical protein